MGRNPKGRLNQNGDRGDEGVSVMWDPGMMMKRRKGREKEIKGQAARSGFLYR